MKKETVEEYLKRGGKINVLPPVKAKPIHRTRSHSANLEDAVRELWKGNWAEAIRLASN